MTTLGSRKLNFSTSSLECCLVASPESSRSLDLVRRSCLNVCRTPGRTPLLNLHRKAGPPCFRDLGLIFVKRVLGNWGSKKNNYGVSQRKAWRKKLWDHAKDFWVNFGSGLDMLRISNMELHVVSVPAEDLNKIAKAKYSSPKEPSSSKTLKMVSTSSRFTSMCLSPRSFSEGHSWSEDFAHFNDGFCFHHNIRLTLFEDWFAKVIWVGIVGDSSSCFRQLDNWKPIWNF